MKIETWVAMQAANLTGQIIRDQLIECSNSQFTGYLDLRAGEIQAWKLHFRLGRLVDASSTMHPLRRWNRQIQQYCTHLSSEDFQQVARQNQCDISQSISALIEQQKISRQQIEQVIKGNLLEILFDIMQLGTLLDFQGNSQLTCVPIAQEVSALPLVLVRPEEVWPQAYQGLRMWQQAGLLAQSPNLSPQLSKDERLRQQASLQVCQSLEKLIGQPQTLRDLSVKLNKPVLSVIQALIPFVQTRLIQLKEIGDLNCSIPTPSERVPVRINSHSRSSPIENFSHQGALNTPPQQQAISTFEPKSSTKIKRPLTIYIEDSEFDSRLMKNVVTSLECGYLNIPDPIQALPILIEKKPEIIFLDLVMPIANGYEICAQIRRVSQFKSTPIIIVTSSDGIVDRVRAKIVGASGFMAKPVRTQRVQAVLQKFLPVPPTQ